MGLLGTVLRRVGPRRAVLVETEAPRTGLAEVGLAEAVPAEARASHDLPCDARARQGPLGGGQPRRARWRAAIRRDDVPVGPTAPATLSSPAVRPGPRAVLQGSSFRGSGDDAPQPRAVFPKPRAAFPRAVLAVAALLRRQPWLITAALCGLSLALGLTGPDTPAQEYRVWLFKHGGAVLWDDQWYGGHTVPGYSVLFPPLGALFGVQALGCFACVASTVIVTRLLRGRGRTHGHDLALVWFSVATVANLVVGRMPFALGMAFGGLALLGVRERRTKTAWAGAIGSSLASPLAGGFVLLIGVALLGTLPRRRVLPLAGAMSGIVVALLFPEHGVQPFPAMTFLSLLALIGAGLFVVPRHEVAIRRGLMLWAAAAAVFFFVPTQIGGNIARPATLLAGPLAAMLLARRPRVLLVVAIPLLGWQIGPVHGALATYGDASGQAGYYTGLLDYLDHGPVAVGRVEIPFTRAHWEASFVAPHVPLARGWERQLDMEYNSLFYDGTLSPETYHKWLLERGVRFVARPDVELDSSAVEEAKLLDVGLPYLDLVWSDAHWKVWLVTDSPGLVRGPAALTELGVSSLAVNFHAPGVATVLVHFTPYWQLDDGHEACVFEAADGWTGILTEQPGPVRLSAKLTVSGLTRASALDCPPDPRVH
ncbi:putative integral membrane protein [Candidatus Protofrankia datiscae]|uniref:Putative integral membrane protein n=1 Tax=Candidatus Protofrankia datiscae TaxID=2716812 RepID=F8AZD8_9ACTN|nr:putative integral membrane protein [Candidatus Protofrankia datiscae]